MAVWSQKSLKMALQEIAEDIYQLILPLPFALKSVNCYLLRDGDGWAIFDAGLNVPEAQDLWLHSFAALEIKPSDITHIILTHAHPDHYGLAGWLQAWCGAPVWMSPREAELAEQIWQRSYEARGMLSQAMSDILDEEKIASIINSMQRMREMTAPHPQEIKRLAYGSSLMIGQHQFQAIHAPGHSDGQLIFYDASDRLLLCGDQVLQKITPNIGLWAISEPDPLGRFLTSLNDLKSLDVRLALPGHGALITTWSERIQEIEAHHAERLAKMLNTFNGTGRKLYDICTAVFKVQSFNEHELRFAIAETLAHLEYLVGRQILERENSDDWRYRQIK